MSFRTRVAVLVAAVVAVVVAGVAGAFLYLARGKALDSLDVKLKVRAAEVTQLGDKLGGPGQFDRRLFGRYSPDDVLVQIVDTKIALNQNDVITLHFFHDSPPITF